MTRQRDRRPLLVTVPGSRRLDGTRVPDRDHVMTRTGRRLVPLTTTPRRNDR